MREVCHTNQFGSTINNQSNFLFFLHVNLTRYVYLLVSNGNMTLVFHVIGSNRRLVSSVGRAPVCCAGGRGFEPQTGPTLRVLK